MDPVAEGCGRWQELIFDGGEKWLPVDINRFPTGWQLSRVRVDMQGPLWGELGLAGLSIRDKTMVAARSAPQGAHYLTNFIYLSPYVEINGSRCLWFSELDQRQLGFQSTFVIPRKNSLLSTLLSRPSVCCHLGGISCCWWMPRALRVGFI